MKRKRKALQLLRVIFHRKPKVERIDGWKRVGPFWIPDKRRSKP